MKIYTEEQYVRKHCGPSDDGLIGTTHNMSAIAIKRWLQQANEQARVDYNHRGRIRKEYADRVAAGEIRPPTSDELLAYQASGHPDNESTQAAKRVIEKRRKRCSIPSSET